MMERQWNPSKEEQAEGRIVRIGQTASKLTCTYMQVINTIDDDLGKLVEKKRAMKANVLDGKETDWNESSLIRELAEILANR
jgi:SNF2 family DNA or RNA helicase